MELNTQNREQWLDEKVEQMKKVIPEDLIKIVRAGMDLAYTVGKVEATQEVSAKFEEIFKF